MKTAAVIASCLTPCLVHGFQPLITDDTGTQGTAGNQTELSYNRTMDKESGVRTVTQDIPFVYTRGITDALDLYAGFTYQRIAPPAPDSTERGWSNPALGAKWRFYEDEAGKLSFALKPEVRLPVSESREGRGLGTARASYSAGLLATQETAFGAVHGNLAVERTDYSEGALDAAERRTLYRLSVAPVWHVTPHWKVALDAGVATNPDRTARRHLTYGEVGAIYAPGKDFEFALGVIRNFRDGRVRTTQLTLGLTTRFR